VSCPSALTSLAEFADKTVTGLMNEMGIHHDTPGKSSAPASHEEGVDKTHDVETKKPKLTERIKAKFSHNKDKD
jgi:hypothetical protein